jgi:5'-3' exonuclease
MEGNSVKKICLLDCDSILYIVCHNKKDEVEKTLEEVKQKLDEFISDIFIKTESTHYLIFLTLTKSFRSYYYTQYKSNRKGREKPKFFTEITNYLLEKYQAVWYNELEADDLCLITRDCLNDHLENFAFISSPDKDILHLEGTHYNYRIGDWVSTTKEEAQKYFWTSMLVGDSADGIKGIPGMGPKGAEELLKERQSTSYCPLVLIEYRDNFGEYEGIQQFYNNFQALYILDKHKDYEQVLQEPIEI